MTLEHINSVSIGPLKCSWNTFSFFSCDWNFWSKCCPSSLVGLSKDSVKEYRKLIIWLLVALYRVLNHAMKCYTSGLCSYLGFHTESKKNINVLWKGVRVSAYAKQAYKIYCCDKSRSCGIFSSKLIVTRSSESSECMVRSSLSQQYQSLLLLLSALLVDSKIYI